MSIMTIVIRRIYVGQLFLRKLILSSLSIAPAIVVVLPFLLPCAARAELNYFGAYADEMQIRSLRVSSGPFGPSNFHESHAFLFADQFDKRRLVEAWRLPAPNGGPVNKVLQSAITTDLMCGDLSSADGHLKQYLLSADPVDFAGSDGPLDNIDSVRFWAKAANGKALLPVLEKLSKLMLGNLASPGQKICSYEDVLDLGLMQMDLLERSGTKDARLPVLADRLYLMRSYCINHHFVRRLADYYYRHGQYQKAKQVLLDWTANLNKKYAGRASNPWVERLLLKDNFVLAQICLKMANFKAAHLYVDKAERHLKNLSVPSPESDSPRSEVDEVLPVASDIVDLRNAIAQRKSVPAPKYDGYKSKNAEQITWYERVRQAREATRSDNDALVKKTTLDLLALYKVQKTDGPVFAGQLSWFDTMLSFARLLSDQGYSDLSEQVLNALKTPEGASIYVEAEHTVNAFRTGKKINFVDLKKASGADFAIQKILRCLGLLNTQIGDEERARLFYSLAQSLYGKKNPPSPEEALLCLDVALVEMRAGNSEKAFQSALRGQSMVEALSANEIDFAKLYRVKVCDLVRAGLAKKEYLASKSYAERVRDSLSRPALRCDTSEANLNGQGDKADALFDGLFAEIYFACGDTRKALESADRAITLMKVYKAPADADLVYLKARCAALAAGPAAAAAAYLEVPEAAQGALLGFYYYPHLNELYLRYLLIAKGFAAKDNNIDPVLKKKIDDGVKMYSDELELLRTGALPPPRGNFAGCGNAMENK